VEKVLVANIWPDIVERVAFMTAELIHSYIRKIIM